MNESEREKRGCRGPKTIAQTEVVTVVSENVDYVGAHGEPLTVILLYAYMQAVRTLYCYSHSARRCRISDLDVRD